MRHECYNHSDGDSVFAPVADAIRELLEMGYEKQELANRLGPLIDVIDGDIQETKREGQLKEERKRRNRQRRA